MDSGKTWEPDKINTKVVTHSSVKHTKQILIINEALLIKSVKNQGKKISCKY